MNVEGGCHCGQITFRAEVDPNQVEICHCTDCQTLSGSAYRTVVPAKEGTFELLTGELKMYAKTADDGSIRVQPFCPECGTPIYSSPPEGAPGFFGIRVGTIKQRNQLVPKNQYWVRSAQTWAQELSDMPKTETQ
jgi:hypothetical protein